MSSHSMPVALFCLTLAGAANAAPPESAHHDHTAHAAKAVQAPAGGWATDAPLREGMQRVQAALADLHHHELGHMTEAQARERAVTIEDAIQSMFAHCKLAPESDAALHSILVPLLAAAQRLDKDPNDRAAVAAMREAVAPYAQQFDDPQWPRDAKPVSHGEHAH